MNKEKGKKIRNAKKLLLLFIFRGRILAIIVGKKKAGHGKWRQKFKALKGMPSPPPLHITYIHINTIKLWTFCSLRLPLDLYYYYPGMNSSHKILNFQKKYIK